MKILGFVPVILASVLMLILGVFAPPAHVDEFHQATLMTFSRPVEIPGKKVLAAGSYWFRLLNPTDDQNVVVIYNARRSHVEAMLMTRPTVRLNPVPGTEIDLAQQSSNAPDALLAWFYPGHESGHEFIYSQGTERQSAERHRSSNFCVTTTLDSACFAGQNAVPPRHPTGRRVGRRGLFHEDIGLSQPHESV